MRSSGNGGFQIRLLGPLELTYHDRDWTPSAPKLRQVLAILALQANRIVTCETLFRELWEDDPPRSASTTLQTYVYQLRKLFKRAMPASENEEILVRKPAGYLLKIPFENIDLYAYHRLVRQGAELLHEGKHGEARKCLRSALAQWTDWPLTNVNVGARLSPYVVDLREQYLNTLRSCMEIEIEAGLHQSLVGELRSLIAFCPYDEWLYGLLIRVLHLCGRRHEALNTYHLLRDKLNDDLGLDPSVEIMQLQNEVLAGHASR